jgi:FAD-dependent oxidoreductase domain-containing protein 1
MKRERRKVLEEVDVLVVGAGILGVSSAYHIAKSNPGKRVMVIDRYGAPAQGNTGRSNAMFRDTFSSKDNQTLTSAAIDFYLHVQDEEKEDIGLQQIGYLWLMSEERLSANERALAGMSANGVQYRRLGRAELSKRLPALRLDGSADEQAALLGLPRIAEGIFGPKCGRLAPERLVQYYARRFTELGGKFSFNTEAEELLVGPRNPLDIDGEPFIWQDTALESVSLKGDVSGVVHPETVVLACGAWTTELLRSSGLDGHVRAKKRQLFSLGVEAGTSLDGLLHSKGFNELGLLPLVVLPKAGVHFKPVSEEGAFWTGCEDEIGRPYIDAPEHDLDRYMAEPAFYERNLNPLLTGYFPAFALARVKAMWAGLYSYNTVDFLPFVFQHGNLIVVGGDSGSGIMKGDSLGRIVAAVYGDQSEAVLYNGVTYRAAKLGFDHRDVEKEEWVI